jgi:DNA polymerase-1
MNNHTGEPALTLFLKDGKLRCREQGMKLSGDERERLNQALTSIKQVLVPLLAGKVHAAATGPPPGNGKLTPPSEPCPMASSPTFPDVRRKGPAGNGYLVRTNGQAEPPAPPTGQPQAYQLVVNQADLPMVLAALDNTRLVGLDTETTGLNPKKDKVRLITLDCDTTGDDAGRVTFVIDCVQADPRPLWDALAGKTIVGHNFAFDLAFLGKLGFTPTDPALDTMLLSQLVYAGQTLPPSQKRLEAWKQSGKKKKKPRGPRLKHGLEVCAGRELGLTVDKSLQKSDWSGVLTQAQLAYAAQDAAVLPPLVKALRQKIREARMDAVADIEAAALPAVVWLAQQGVGFDLEAWQALAGAAAQEAALLKEQLHQAAPPRKDGLFDGRWNWDAGAQVKQVLALVGHEVEHTDDETLAGLDHPLADLLRRYRTASKRASTYGADWDKYVQGERLYGSWHQQGAWTGRMSASQPNLTNILSEKTYRRCFVAPPGRVLVKADYSQIELRVVAKIANETVMIAAFRDQQDLHALTARRLTGKTLVTEADRKLAKPINFGLIYGLSVAALRRKAKEDPYNLDLSLEDAERYHQAFFKAYPGIAAWHRRIRCTHARETRTLAGRRVLVEPDGFFGMKANYLVQGSAGDGLKNALALLWQRRSLCPGAFPVLAVHDEIVVEADLAQADLAAAWVKAAMLDGMQPLIDPVPVKVDVTIGKTWAGD